MFRILRRRRENMRTVPATGNGGWRKARKDRISATVECRYQVCVKV
jgi:hypothetical protein